MTERVFIILITNGADWDVGPAFSTWEKAEKDRDDRQKQMGPKYQVQVMERDVI